MVKVADQSQLPSNIDFHAVSGRLDHGISTVDDGAFLLKVLIALQLWAANATYQPKPEHHLVLWYLCMDYFIS